MVGKEFPYMHRPLPRQNDQVNLALMESICGDRTRTIDVLS